MYFIPNDFKTAEYNNIFYLHDLISKFLLDTTRFGRKLM